MKSVTFSGCVSALAICRDCGWEYENHRNALALAKKHHNKTGHTVHIELVNSVTYKLEEETSDRNSQPI